MQAMNYIHFVKQPNLKLKTRPKQPLDSLPLAFELPGLVIVAITSVLTGLKGQNFTNVHEHGGVFFNFLCSLF
jgi:hypothetical protein